MPRSVFYSPSPKPKENLPMQSTHQTALQQKHATLDQRLSDETHRPLPDASIVADLKKQKLRLKEEIARA